MTQIDQQNVPKLRFPDFSEPLTSVKLGEIASFSKGKGISKNDITPDGALPCIRYGELYTVYDTIIDEPVSSTDAPASTLTLSKGNEVLVPASGEDAKDIATAVVVKKPGVALGGDLNIIRSENDGAFLASYLSGRKRMTLAAMAQGNSVVHLYPAQLKALDIHLPTLPEQRKIASFLGVVDAKITQLAEKKRLLEDYKKGCMQQLFSQKIRFKDEEDNDFPDWELVGAGNLFQSVSNKNHNGDLPLLSITQEHGATLRDGLDKDIQVSAEGIKNYKIVEPDDFIISLRSFQGGIEHSSVLGICSPAYTILKPTRNIVPGFFKQLFKREQFVSQLSATTIGIREGKQISFGAFATLKLPLPHPAEQRKIADFLSALDRKIDLVGQELSHARMFKQGLLQQMFV